MQPNPLSSPVPLALSCSYNVLHYPSALTPTRAMWCLTCASKGRTKILKKDVSRTRGFH